MVNKISGIIFGILSMGCGWSRAEVQTSPVFIYACGFNSDGWNTRETATVNTPTIQENFKLEAVVNGAGYTGWGPTFPEGIIATGGAGDYVAEVGSFSLVLTGRYLSPLPGRQYRLCLAIESLSIWGSINGAVDPSDGTLSFVETTWGHAQSQPPQTIYYRDGNRYFYSWAFTKVQWNPDDWWSLDATVVTRTFALAGSANVVVDGLEIVGTVTVADLAAGDANGDGRVDVGDLGILAANYGAIDNVAWEKGDFNGDQVVDVGDLGILAAHYGPPTTVPYDTHALGFVANKDDQNIGSPKDMASISGWNCSPAGLMPMAGILLADLVLGGLRMKV